MREEEQIGAYHQMFRIEKSFRVIRDPQPVRMLRLSTP
jgi:hypothetical protein